MPRSSSSRAFSLACLAALCLVASSAHALQVTGLTAQNKRGQTFLTWNNLPGTGWKYHVYASNTAVRSSYDFATSSWELGVVGDSSAVDQRISTLLGETLTFHTESEGPPLSAHLGFFVTTPSETGLMHYVVLAEHELYPISYLFLPGQNTTVDAVWEQLDTPRPIWQRTIAYPPCEDYVLFASANDVPGMQAMWQRDGHALHFGVIPGRPGGALLLHGHGHGGSFLNSIVGTGDPDETVIAPDDYLPSWDRSSFYLGYNNVYDPNLGKNRPVSGGIVIDYTDRFVLYLMDWAQANYGSDSRRVYAMGSSMGGSFAFFLAWHHPERIAAALSNIPKLCASYTGDTSPTLTATFERMWSPIPVNLPTTVEGIPVFDWMDGRMLAQRFYSRGAAPVFGFVGRNDDIVGWEEKVPLFQALQQYRAGGAWFWDTRGHMDNQNQTAWAPVQNEWARLYRYRLDRSYPALSNCSADFDAGDGSRESGDAVGTINGHVDWDEELVDTRDRWECVLRSRTLTTLGGDLLPPSSITVDVTPRRLQQFRVSSRTSYRYTVTDATSGEWLAGGMIDADAGYLLTVPAVPVSAGGSRLSLEPTQTLGVVEGPAPRVPRLALGANPVRGGSTLQVAWPGDGEARVDLLDAAGRRVRSLFAGAASGGVDLRLDAAGLAPGVYLVYARQGERQASKRIVVVP